MTGDARTARTASTASTASTVGTGPLTAAGWRPGRDAGDAALLAVLKTAPLGPWELFPAAESALRAFHGLRIPAWGPGRDVAPTGCVVDPVEARHAGRTFGRLAQVLGVRLFPFGRTDADSLLGVDELGRLFCVDHGGDRLLGDTVPDGLTALAEGHAPVRLTARHRSWTLDGHGDGHGPGEGDPVRVGARAALVAVYVLHAHAAFSAREVRLRVTTLRGVGVLALDQAFPLRPGRLEDSAEPLAADMAAALEAGGLRPQGAELMFSVPAAAAPGELECAVTVGTAGAAAPRLTLTAGPGAAIGRPAEAFAACAAAFDRQTRP
ncbi:SUKH-3 domain-containing protein [Streptomyces sp. NPDC002138]|uniref:SUKH-3 domain-containing protein n=1 Tax=Streptomyces sp. NPDC002138 TaxID=3154410 RepID=UPI0033180FB1